MRVGIYNPNLSTKGGGEKVCLALAEALSPGNDILVITHKTLDKKELEDYFGVNLSRTQISVIETSKFVKRFQHARWIPNHLKKFFENYSVYNNAKKLDLDVFINNAYNTEIPSPAKYGIFMCMFPHKLLDKSEMSFLKKTYITLVDWFAKTLMHPSTQTWLDTYQSITANSKFTQKYIKEYWDRESDIVYPICDDMKVRGVEKRNIILNIGRFFHNNGITHHKRQDFLVDSFIKMKELHEKKWELHLVGTVNENSEDMRYVVDLLKRSEGFPVYLHLDMPLPALKNICSQAKIYWHATGYGANKKLNPERQEHFGIATVEAMTTGAVPVVIDSAGQAEIISEGKNGFLWSDETELLSKTSALLDSSNSTISNSAMLRARDFDKKSFQSQAVTVFEKLTKG